MNEKDMREKMKRDMEQNNLHELLGIHEIPDTDSELEETARRTNALTPEQQAEFIKYYNEKLAKQQYENQLREQQMPNHQMMNQQMPNFGLGMNVIDEEPVMVKEEIKVEEPKKVAIEDKVEIKENVVIEEAPKVKEPVVEIEDPKDEFNFNIDEIEFIDTPDGFTAMDNFRASFDLAETYQVTCNQSRYVANMKAIKYGDALTVANSTASPYQERSKVYQMIYNKIESTSIDDKNGKKIDYNTFLKHTSFYDLETLMFGIYQKSFPGSTEFNITCKHCKGTSSIEVQNDNLIAVKDENIYADIQDILKRAVDPESALKESILNKNARKILSSSKLMVDVSIPSLHRHLELIGSVSPDKLEQNQQLLTLMLFIKKMYMLDRESTKKFGKPRYYEITSREEMANILENLPIKDYKELGKLIEEKTSETAITYKIKSFPCPKCHEELGEMEVDIESLLFSNALQ